MLLSPESTQDRNPQDARWIYKRRLWQRVVCVCEQDHLSTHGQAHLRRLDFWSREGETGDAVLKRIDWSFHQRAERLPGCDWSWARQLCDEQDAWLHELVLHWDEGWYGHWRQLWRGRGSTSPRSSTLTAQDQYWSCKLHSIHEKEGQYRQRCA